MRAFTTGFVASVGLGAVLGLGVGSAMAAEWGTEPSVADGQVALRFERLDQDYDHALSPREARPYPSLTAAFGELDADGDGTLSLAEFSRARAEIRVLSEVFVF